MSKRERPTTKGQQPLLTSCCLKFRAISLFQNAKAKVAFAQMRVASVTFVNKMFLTTIVILSGPPGFCDSDTEYFYTAKYPTKRELEQFVKTCYDSYSFIRKTKIYIQADGGTDT